MRYLIPALFLAAPALADAPVVENVTARTSGDGWRFDVTIRHPDTGWDHYADGWQVLYMDGNELGMRVLYHPHVDEQPFTRSLGSVQVPKDAKQVQIRARDSVHGWNADTYVIDLK